jgi:hypothetical protein
MTSPHVAGEAIALSSRQKLLTRKFAIRVCGHRGDVEKMNSACHKLATRKKSQLYSKSRLCR